MTDLRAAIAANYAAGVSSSSAAPPAVAVGLERIMALVDRAAARSKADAGFSSRSEAAFCAMAAALMSAYAAGVAVSPGAVSRCIGAYAERGAFGSAPTGRVRREIEAYCRRSGGPCTRCREDYSRCKYCVMR